MTPWVIRINNHFETPWCMMSEYKHSLEKWQKKPWQKHWTISQLPQRFHRFRVGQSFTSNRVLLTISSLQGTKVKYGFTIVTWAGLMDHIDHPWRQPRPTTTITRLWGITDCWSKASYWLLVVGLWSNFKKRNTINQSNLHPFLSEHQRYGLSGVLDGNSKSRSIGPQQTM